MKVSCYVYSSKTKNCGRICNRYIPSMLIQTSRIILHIYTLCNFILCMVLKANMYAKMPKFVNFYAFLQHKIGWIFDIHTKFQECYFISRLDAKLFFIFNTYVNKTLNRILNDSTEILITLRIISSIFIYLL